MNKTVFAILGIFACANATFADANARVTAAATDPSKIAEILKQLDGQSLSGFAGDVMSAISAMPVGAAKKVKQMANASTAFLGEVKSDEMAGLLGALTAAIPFSSLPEWTRLFRPDVSAITEEMPDDQYNKLVSEVLNSIDQNGNVKDKTVVTAFALQLLARGKNVEEKTAWFETIKPNLPKSSADNVATVMPSVFKGNYDSLLAGEKIVRTDMRIVTPLSTILREDSVGVTDEAEMTDVGRPAPIDIPEGVGDGRKPKKSTPKKPAPPIPPPYAGQF